MINLITKTLQHLQAQQKYLGDNVQALRHNSEAILLLIEAEAEANEAEELIAETTELLTEAQDALRTSRLLRAFLS